MDFKELYMEECDRIAFELEEGGMSPKEAEEKAADLAYDSARDRLADTADYLYHKSKE